MAKLNILGQKLGNAAFPTTFAHCFPLAASWDQSVKLIKYKFKHSHRKD
jgi:hypothetical protein